MLGMMCKFSKIKGNRKYWEFKHKMIKYLIKKLTTASFLIKIQA